MRADFFLAFVRIITYGLDTTWDGYHGLEQDFCSGPGNEGTGWGMQAERLAMTCHQSRIATAGVSTFGATALAFNRMLGGRARRELKHKEPCNER